jgi:hypothetical protein
MGQNRQKTGKTGLLTPSTNSGRLEPEWVRAKSNSPSPAQRSVQAGAQKANSYHLPIAYLKHPLFNQSRLSKPLARGFSVLKRFSGLDAWRWMSNMRCPGRNSRYRGGA